MIEPDISVHDSHSLAGVIQVFPVFRRYGFFQVVPPRNLVPTEKMVRTFTDEALEAMDEAKCALCNEGDNDWVFLCDSAMRVLYHKACRACCMQIFEKTKPCPFCRGYIRGVCEESKARAKVERMKTRMKTMVPTEGTPAGFIGSVAL